jgi:hypothetical protein
MRRVFLDDSMSSAAVWSWRLCLFASCFTFIAWLVVRTQALDITTALVLLIMCGVLIFGALILAGLGARHIWREGVSGIGFLAATLVLSTMLLTIPVIAGVSALIYPPLVDISTDIDTPPVMVMTEKALNARQKMSPVDLKRDDRLLQKKAYPDLAPLFLDLPPDEAIELVTKALRQAGMAQIDTEVIAAPVTTKAVDKSNTASPARRAVAGQGRGKNNDKAVPELIAPPLEYRLQALDHSLILGWPVDLVVRVRLKGEGSRVDVRAVSRRGSHDFGENARRIQKIIAEINFIASTN